MMISFMVTEMVKMMMMIIIIYIIIIIIIIIIILGISFMQGIYTYIPETNHVPREHRVATILMYEVCSKSIGPLVGKNTIIYLDVWKSNPLQSSLFGNAHTSSSGPAIAGNISGKLLVESCSAGLSRSA